MKKLCAILLMLMMLATPALAASTETGFLRVDGCKEWVSLREEPSTEAKRLKKIPLGAVVQISVDPFDSEEFCKVWYAGEEGYVLRKYLYDRNSKYHIPMYAVKCKEYVSLRKFPDTSSERIEKILPGEEVIGMCYGFIDDNGTSMVRTHMLPQEPYREGFVHAGYLSFLPEDRSVRIESASLHVNKPDADLYVQTVTDRALLDELEQMILNATPSDVGKCPVGALLELNLSDSRTLYFTYPLDGCSALIAQNLCIYSFKENQWARFWEIFQEAGRYRF